MVVDGRLEFQNLIEKYYGTGDQPDSRDNSEFGVSKENTDLIPS